MEADDAGFCHHFKDGPIPSNCPPPTHDAERSIATENQLKFSALFSRHHLNGIPGLTAEHQRGYLHGLFKK